MDRLSLNAALSNNSLFLFNKNRQKEYYYLYNYFVDYINIHAEIDLINYENKGDGLEKLIQIFSTAAFIKWKLLSDFSTDAIKIAKDLIIPINSIVKNAGITSSYCGGQKIINKILYFPQLHPLGTAASSKSAKGIIETFAKNKLNNNIEYSLFTFALNPSIDKNYHETQFYSEALQCNLILFEYKNFNCLPEIIDHINPDGIIYDYFTYPWTFIPYCYPKIKFVYMSFGFVPCIFDHTHSIICLEIDKNTENFIANNSIVHSFGLKQFHARAELNISNINPTKDVSITNKIEKFRNKFKFIAITLCRSSKISTEYLEFIYSLLKSDPNLGFIAAGPGVVSIHIDKAFLDKIILFDEISPGYLYDVADIYIETFPEHQGRSVVEAIEENIPVVYLCNDSYTHTLLHERSAVGLCKSKTDFLSLSYLILNDFKFKSKFIDEQIKISNNFLCKPDKVWEIIIQAFDYYD